MAKTLKERVDAAIEAGEYLHKVANVYGLPEGAYFEVNAEPGEQPLPLAIWLEDDIIGAGDSYDEALDDAHDTVEGWES